MLLFVFIQAMAELYLPTLMADIVDTGIVKGDTDYIWRMGGFMLLVALFSAVCSIAASFLAARVAAGMGRNLRQAVFTRAESFSLTEFDAFGTSTLITRTTNDITQVQQIVVMMLRMMSFAPLMCVGGLIMAVSKDAKLSLVLFVALPVLAGVIALIAAKGIPLFRAMQVKLDKLNQVVREGLTGIRVVRAFDRETHQQERFDETNLDLTDTAIKANLITGTMWPIMMLVMNLTTVAIVWFGGLRIDSGGMQVGDLMAFIQYAMQILFSLVMFSMMFSMLPRASASATRINEVLQTLPTLQDKAETKRAEDRRGHVEFRNVTFSYPGAEAPALHDISFSAGPGEVTAIIGGTGSGKSTLISLIPRFYDIQEGSILVDGVDVREMAQTDLRAKIGLVPQKALLFTGTVAENIRYGKDTATIEEVGQALETAQAMEFVSAMRDGFESVLAQGGNNLSGGQKQRLSIARALIRRPEIYLFDDSFSALDFKTDARLRAALRKETRDATVLIVAQRVSTVMDADRIIVLDEGRIVGMGTHRELLGSSQVYREIVSSQLSEEELA